MANSQSDPDLKETLTQLAVQLQASADSQKALADGLRTAADSIRADASSAQAEHDKVSALAAQAKNSVGQLSEDYNNTIKPQLDTLMDQVSAMSGSISSSASTLGSVGDDLQNGADSLAGRIATSKQKLLDTASDLDDSAQKLTSLSTAMREALSSGDLEQLRTVLYSDPDALASALAAPVQLERNAVFPADNFGSQMAPLYTTSFVDWFVVAGGCHQGGSVAQSSDKAGVSKTAPAVLGAFWRIRFRFPVSKYRFGFGQHAVLAGAGEQSVVVSDLLLVGGFGVYLHHLFVGGIVCQLG